MIGLEPILSVVVPNSCNADYTTLLMVSEVGFEPTLQRPKRCVLPFRRFRIVKRSEIGLEFVLRASAGFLDNLYSYYYTSL